MARAKGRSIVEVPLLDITTTADVEKRLVQPLLCGLGLWKQPGA